MVNITLSLLLLFIALYTIFIYSICIINKKNVQKSNNLIGVLNSTSECSNDNT